MLALSHGNADVERGFSENAHLVTDERASLSVVSISGLRATKDAVKFHGDGAVQNVAITKALLSSVKQAHERFKIDNERQQQMLKDKELSEQALAAAKNDEVLLIEKECKLLDEQKGLRKELESATNMLDEDSEQLTAAIAEKNFSEVETE
ncbi:unnamed protein product [Didymodactylos carnosus]|uniref:Uncharacterized protein n=1 Tax=Didymodactylos carnosus TaxID=1234261 RepID=A0A815QV63_9BILA|nr:unnamed protein product [Didymodactylos carnosus]CAF1468282.1 unnamed protein product [Didymodactylos carnosus]CAF4127015.1 unnamed protein product [Didymodactylos carnosus]CAF4336764.1 unnamed protein product [Didymodactylos carnosus]